MDEKCSAEAKKDPTIPSLDGDLARITGRLSEILDDLNAGVWGNQNKTEDCESSPMENPSLASLSKRVGYIFTNISDIERLVRKIHNSNPVCSN